MRSNRTAVELADVHLHQCTCLASRISIQKEPYSRSEFTPALHLDILDAECHLQILYEDL